MFSHHSRKYRLLVIVSAVLIAALAWALVAFAGSKNYDANNDGQIDSDEIVEVARDYMRGEVTQEEAVDHLFWAFSGMERWGTPVPTPTPTLRSTPTPYYAPTATPTPVPTATPRPTPTVTPTPEDEPIPRLDCPGAFYEYASEAPPIRATSRHIDVTVVHPDRPEGDSEETKPGGLYQFEIFEHYRVSGGATVDQKGFILKVFPLGGSWQYERVGPTTFDRSTILASGYFDEDGIPFNRGWGAENRLTFLTRSPERDEYRFYVNGYKVPVPFSGIEDILSQPHEPYHASRWYMMSKSYYSPRYSFTDLCIPKSWVTD